MNNLKEMDNCLLAANENENTEVSKQHLNEFIDLFLMTNNTMNGCPDLEEVREGTERLSSVLVEIVEIYNESSQTSRSLEKLQNEFESWAELLNKHVKYKILVLGVNHLSLCVDRLIDRNKADIVAFVDDGGDNSGKYINNLEIIDLNGITHKLFDYVFSISANDHIVSNLKRILGDERFIDYHLLKTLILSSPEFYIKHFDFLSNEKNFTGILTGLSYVQKGVNEKLLRGNFVNLANPGQDLFYDFEMFKYAYSQTEISENLQYAIIGLSYYSFHYDLSRSANEARVNYYYPITKSMHNNERANQYLYYHHMLEKVESDILQQGHFLAAFEPEKDYFQKIINDGYSAEYDCQKQTYEEIIEGIESIKRDFNKNYPITVAENKEILRGYLEFLVANSIKPIIMICPVTKLYQSFTPKAFKHELYEIINKLSSEIHFQFLDYYSSDEFDDSDFYDPSHMNYKGAEKLSNILNRDIVW